MLVFSDFSHLGLHTVNFCLMRVFKTDEVQTCSALFLLSRLFSFSDYNKEKGGFSNYIVNFYFC